MVSSGTSANPWPDQHFSTAAPPEFHLALGLTLARRAQELRRQLAHINTLILSPDADWMLITRDEVRAQKRQLAEELAATEAQLAQRASVADSALELSQRTFRFCAYARFWLREGDLKQERAILGALSWNLTLKDGTLDLELKNPLQLVTEMQGTGHSDFGRFEPATRGMIEAKSPRTLAGIPSWCPRPNAIRTYWLEHPEEPAFPDLPPPLVA